MDTQEQHQLFWVRDDGQNRTANMTLPFDSGMRNLRFYSAALFPSPLAWDTPVSFDRGI
jgi:hypothetical protein